VHLRNKAAQACIPYDNQVPVVGFRWRHPHLYEFMNGTAVVADERRRAAEPAIDVFKDQRSPISGSGRLDARTASATSATLPVGT
jgi:hypothetical protein